MCCGGKENAKEEALLTRQERLSHLMDQTTHYIHHYLGRRQGQGRVLRVLNRCGSMTQQELQNRLSIQSSSASELLTKLETAGFITRERDEADRRRCIISITEAGRLDLREHEAARRRRQSILYDVLEEEEQEELIRILTKLRANWERMPSAREKEGSFAESQDSPDSASEAAGGSSRSTDSGEEHAR